MKFKTTLLALVVVISLGLAGTALAVDPQEMPGYVDIERIEFPPDAEEITDIKLGPDLLKAAAPDKSNPKLAKLLSQIYSIRVKAFGMEDASGQQVRRQIQEIQTELDAKGWEQMIHVRNRDQMFTISAKHDGEAIVGLMAMGYEDDDQAFFANIVGDLDLGLLIGLGMELGDGEFEEFLENLEDLDEG